MGDNSRVQWQFWSEPSGFKELSKSTTAFVYEIGVEYQHLMKLVISFSSAKSDKEPHRNKNKAYLCKMVQGIEFSETLTNAVCQISYSSEVFSPELLTSLTFCYQIYITKWRRWLKMERHFVIFFFFFFSSYRLSLVGFLWPFYLCFPPLFNLHLYEEIQVLNISSPFNLW